MLLSTRQSSLFMFLGLFTVAVAQGGWLCEDKLRTIDEGWVCDYSIDCLDGSDETPRACANKSCSGDQFRCNNTRCIDKSYVCDGEPDCQDGDRSDEENCNEPASSIAEVCGAFKCATNKDCLPFAWVCDGERDCPDASDEHNCPCDDDSYGCYSRGASLCFKNSTKCDGTKHCDDGEDEQGCGILNLRDDDEFSCPPNKYKCRSKKECVLWKLVCDGTDDCRDGSDEGGLCHVDDCGKKSLDGLHKTSHRKVACEQYCHNTPDGAKCACDFGFGLAHDDIHCIDVDECEEMSSDELPNAEKLSRVYNYGLESVCSQQCINLAGGFHCACANGYELDADGYSCKALGYFSPELYVGVNNEIRSFALRASGEKSYDYITMYESEEVDETILDIDVFVAALTVIWAEKKSGRLMMMNGPHVAQINIGFSPRAVSVDWTTFNLYVITSKFGAKRNPAIMLLTLDEETLKAENNFIEPLTSIELLSKGLKEPVSVTLYPAKGIMVIADIGDSYANGRRIFVANTDGSNVRNLVTDKLLRVTDVIIDEVKNTVYWSSVNKDDSKAAIDTIRLDGTKRRTILSTELSRFPLMPVSIDFFEGRVYISDKQSREVRSWNVDEVVLYGSQNTMQEGSGVVKMQGKTGLGAIEIAHPVLQRPTKDGNLCVSAGCSHACVISPTTLLQIKELLNEVKLKPKCLCPKEYNFRKYGKTCFNEEHEGVKKTLLDLLPRGKKIEPTTTEMPIKIVNVKSSKTTCKSPGPFHNARTVPKDIFFDRDFIVGTVIRIFCLEGYSMKNVHSRKIKARIECLSTGKWSELIPQCVSTRQFPIRGENAVEELHIPTFFDRIASGMSSLIDYSVSKEKLCTSLNCGPWGRCVQSKNEEYECQCPYGDSTSILSRCLPPTENQTTTSAFSSNNALIGSSQPSSSNPMLMTALIITAIVLFAVLAFLSYRCMRKKKYSVDLRYLRGRTSKRCSMNGRNNVLVEVSANGKPTSITNPNYSSPSQRKKLLKPDYVDDGSDSGIQQSLAGSESASSSISDNSACEGTSKMEVEDGRQATNISPLLKDEVYEDEVAIGDVSIGSLARSGRTSLGNRFGRLFKMRKTESRECMLPKRNSDISRIRRFPSHDGGP